MPPRSGLITIGERSFTLRVPGVGASSSAFSHAVATSMLKRHVVGSVGLRASDQAGCLVVGRIVPMGVDGGRARLQPDGRRALRVPDGLPDSPHARNAGVEDLVPVLLRVAAVHGAAGEVDHDVRPVDLPRPVSLLPGSQRTTRQGAAFGWRPRTTTSWPSPWNARASKVPTWPVPPGITIFIASAPLRRVHLNAFKRSVRPGTRACQEILNEFKFVARCALPGGVGSWRLKILPTFFGSSARIATRFPTLYGVEGHQ